MCIWELTLTHSIHCAFIVNSGCPWSNQTIITVHTDYQSILVGLSLLFDNSIYRKKKKKRESYPTLLSNYLRSHCIIVQLIHHVNALTTTHFFLLIAVIVRGLVWYRSRWVFGQTKKLILHRRPQNCKTKIFSE